MSKTILIINFILTFLYIPNRLGYNCKKTDYIKLTPYKGIL